MEFKKIFSTLILACICFWSFGQNFLVPVDAFSTKKTAYITLMDGTEYTGQFRSGIMVNGVYKTVTLKDEEGKKHKFKPVDIKNMFLPISKFVKISAEIDLAKNASKWEDDSSLNEEAGKEGYAYFENVTVKKKKKDQIVLLQLLNPAYSDKIKVYHNPMANETMSPSIGGIKLAGGDARTYFVSVAGNDFAEKFGKPKYKENYTSLFGECEAFNEKFAEDIRWSDFEKHVYFYETECKE